MPNHPTDLDPEQPYLAAELLIAAHRQNGRTRREAIDLEVAAGTFAVDDYAAPYVPSNITDDQLTARYSTAAGIELPDTIAGVE